MLKENCHFYTEYENNEITKAKSRIDIGTDNYEMGYYVGLLKAIQIIKAGQIYG